MKKLLFILMAVVLVFTVSGCGPKQDSNGSPQKGGNSGIEDLCKVFPKELVEEAIGRPIVKVESSSLTGDKVCTYYTDYSETFYGGQGAGGGAAVAVLEDISVADWQADKEKGGYTLAKDPAISPEHYLVKRSSGETWQVTFIINPNQILRIHTIHSAVTGAELEKIGEKFAPNIGKL